MDNKITKTRLANFLAYEWILMVVMIIVAVIFMELMFAMTSIRLTTGQTFSIYYDENIVSTNKDAFKEMLVDKDTFSFDVLEIGQESLLSEQNVLYLRLSTQEGDIIITDDEEQQSEEISATRAKSLIDTYDMYDMDELYKDACVYLNGFVKEQYKQAGGIKTCPKPSQLDDEKIEKSFNNRLKKDNRFRKKDKKAEGIALEKARLEKLCEDVADFKKLLDKDAELYASSGGEKSYFTYYTKGEQAYKLAEQTNEKDLAEYKEKYETAKEENITKYTTRSTARYALKADMIRKEGTGGEEKRSVDEFFRFAGYSEESSTETAKNVVIEVFNFKGYQQDLQYETISFIISVVKCCSDILD